MKRLILAFAITLIVVSGQGAKAQHPFSSKSTSFQATGDAWFTLSDVVQSELSPDGRYLAVRTSTHFRLYDITSDQTTPTVIIEDEGARVFFDNAQLAFSHDGTWVAAGIPQDRVTQAIRVWEVESREVVAEVSGDFWAVNGLAFSPTNPVLLIAHHFGPDRWMGQISLLDVEQGEIVHEITDATGHHSIVSISPDGEWVLIQFTNGSSDLTMTVNLRTFESHRFDVGCPCHVSPNWEYVMLTSHFDNTYLYSLPTGGASAMTDKLEAFGGFTWNHDGTLVASTDANDRVRIWDIENNIQWTVGVGLDVEWRTHILFHPRQNVIAMTRPGPAIEIWDVEHTTFLGEVSGYTDSIFAWELSPEGYWLAVFSRDEMLYVWDLDTEELILTAHIEPDHGTAYIRKMSFSADGRVLTVLHSQYNPILQVWRLPEE